jgi:hypothetical protein
MKGGRGIAPRILESGARRSRVKSTTPQLLYSRERNVVDLASFVEEAGGLGGKCGWEWITSPPPEFEPRTV